MIEAIRKIIAFSGKEKIFIPYARLQETVLGVFKALLLLLAVAMFISGNETITKTLMMIIISFQVFADIEQTGAGLTVLRVVSSSIEEAEKVNLLPVMDENGKEYVSADHGISLKNVYFAYDDNEILNDISLDIPENTMTAFVGPENEDKLTAAFDALTEKKTVIMIAHRLKTIRNADKIVVIDGGRICSGTREELIRDSERYNKFIRLREEAANWKI